jgi:hypothetical protein
MELLPLPAPGPFLLLVAPRGILREAVPELIARLALAGPLSVLDCGNVFGAHRIARALRRAGPNLQAGLENIHVARAFTCYQVVSLLGGTPTSAAPTIVLDFLSSFADESLRKAERARLLQQSITHLERLSKSAAVAVTTSLSTAWPPEWLDLLAARAERVWHFEEPPSPTTLPLFK